MLWYCYQLILFCAVVSYPDGAIYSPFNRRSLVRQNKTYHKDGLNSAMQGAFNLTKRDSSGLYKGVNLGGWLVLEGWLTSDSPVFQRIKKDIDGQPEHLMLQRKYGFNKNIPFMESGEQNIMYTYDHQLDYYVQKHRREFITEDDFIEIAKAGFNMVRIPIGYWTFGEDNSGGSTNKDWTIFTRNAAFYLDQAFTWGARNGIKVLVGIHAAKGSQNGNEHSSPSDFNERYWYRYEENRKNTIQLVDKIMHIYKGHEAFLGIGLLNEPWLDNDNELGILKQYYNDAYHLIRGSHGSNCIISFSETINGYAPNAWGGFFSNDPNVWHETHLYFVFDDYHKSLNTNQLVADIQTNTRNHMRSIGESRAFVGEWSAAMATDRPPEERGSFLKAQMEAYSNSHWTFWNWKSQESIGYGRGGWSMQEMIRQNILKKEWIGPIADVQIEDTEDEDEPPLEILPKSWKTLKSLLDANLEYEIKDGIIPTEYYESLTNAVRKLVFSENLCETDSIRMQAYGLMKALAVVVEYTKMRFAIDSDPSKVDEDEFLTFQTNGDGRAYFKCIENDEDKKDIECPVPKSSWSKGKLSDEEVDVIWSLNDKEGFQKLLFKTYGIPSLDMLETSDHQVGERRECDIDDDCLRFDVSWDGLYRLNSNIGHPFSAHDVELYHSYYQKQLADVGETFMIKHNDMFTCAIDGEDVDCMRHSLKEGLVITWKAKDPDAALKALEEFSGVSGEFWELTSFEHWADTQTIPCPEQPCKDEKIKLYQTWDNAFKIKGDYPPAFQKHLDEFWKNSEDSSTQLTEQVSSTSPSRTKMDLALHSVAYSLASAEGIVTSMKEYEKMTKQLEDDEEKRNSMGTMILMMGLEFIATTIFTMGVGAVVDAALIGATAAIRLGLAGARMSKLGQSIGSSFSGVMKAVRGASAVGGSIAKGLQALVGFFSKIPSFRTLGNLVAKGFQNIRGCYRCMGMLIASEYLSGLITDGILETRSVGFNEPLTIGYIPSNYTSNAILYKRAGQTGVYDACPDLGGGVSAFRSKSKVLCVASFGLLTTDPADLNKIVKLDKNTVGRKAICEHMVELETIDRGFRAPLLEHHKTLLEQNNKAAAKALCDRYKDKLQRRIFEISNGRDTPGEITNVMLVHEDLEKPKGLMDKGIYDDRVFLTKELDQTWHRKTPGSQTINPGGDLNNVAAYLDSPQLLEAHDNIAEELKKVHAEFADVMKDYPETRNKIITISESGADFIKTRPELYKKNLAIYSEALSSYAKANPTRARADVFKKLDTSTFFVGVDKADAEAMARAKALADEATSKHKVKLRTKSPCA